MSKKKNNINQEYHESEKTKHLGNVVPYIKIPYLKSVPDLNLQEMEQRITESEKRIEGLYDLFEELLKRLEQ